MKNVASFLIFLGATIALVIAGDIQTQTVTSATSPFTIDVPDHFFLRIFNFTQDGGTTRGVVIAGAATPGPTPTPTPTPTITPTPTCTPTPCTPTPTPTVTPT